MIKVEIVGGSELSYPDDSIDGFKILKDLDKSLSKGAIAFKINGVLSDISSTIASNCKIEIISIDSPDGLEILRHDTAHLLAHAVKELYPDTQVTIGPVIEDGFYYDFARDEPFTPDDLPLIEKQMKKIIKDNHRITKNILQRNKALKYFKDIGEDYKALIIADIPEEENITLYSQGDFTDLCRGPHGISTGNIKAFKLTKISGSYWRGDASSGKGLQRIYGTAWASKEDLALYLQRIEEAKKRDHRKIGKELSLFHFQDEAPGAVFWHHKGWSIFNTLVGYMRRKCKRAGYTEISTPEVMAKSLWIASGHVEKFDDNMFSFFIGQDDKKREFIIKPMSCPGGIQVYNHDIKSYKDLPLRIAEFGKVHRNEHSGALHGLMRVRAFTQDDAHIFCTEDQMMEESKKICDLVKETYNDMGFFDIKIKFSDRPEKRIGSDKTWDKAESALKQAADYAGLDWELNKGEGAFYGPKLEFVLKDAIGRDWQLGTLQVDLNLPKRLNAYYIDREGKKQNVVLLHRAILGSMERFIGIMLEHYEGKLPLWIAPIQIAIITVVNGVDDYAKKVAQILEQKLNIRVLLDGSSEKIGFKIRKYALQKIPITLILGESEKETQRVSVRYLGDVAKEDLDLSDFLNKIDIELGPLHSREF